MHGRTHSRRSYEALNLVVSVEVGRAHYTRARGYDACGARLYFASEEERGYERTKSEYTYVGGCAVKNGFPQLSRDGEDWISRSCFRRCWWCVWILGSNGS